MLATNESAIVFIVPEIELIKAFCLLTDLRQSVFLYRLQLSLSDGSLGLEFILVSLHHVLDRVSILRLVLPFGRLVGQLDGVGSPDNIYGPPSFGLTKGL